MINPQNHFQVISYIYPAYLYGQDKHIVNQTERERMNVSLLYTHEHKNNASIQPSCHFFFHIINDGWCPLVFVHRATDNAAGPGLLPAHADGRQHVARPQSAQVPPYLCVFYIFNVIQII